MVFVPMVLVFGFLMYQMLKYQQMEIWPAIVCCGFGFFVAMSLFGPVISSEVSGILNHFGSSQGG